MSNFFHAHAHGRFSALDALTDMDAMVARAKRFKMPAVALTDHGNMAGTVELYLAGKKYGLPVMPGFEGYLVDDTQNKAAPRFHIGMLSLTLPGYQALSEFSTKTHLRENFLRFPRMDFAMLAALSEDPRSKDIAVLTGCYFGLVQQTLVHNGYEAAKRVVAMYARWFKNTLVEIQQHNIDHTVTNPVKNSEFRLDSDFCDALVQMADELGLPVIITQDSHYLDESDKVAHSTMKNITYMGKQEGSESAFPGDSFHYASADWIKEHHDPRHWRRAQETYGLLLGQHDLSIPPLDVFKTHIPRTVPTPKADLRRLVMRGLNMLEKRGGLRKVRRRYEDRIAHELGIINQLRMAGYFMIWVEIVAWCNDKKIAIEARGSSNGSLVCYLLGITNSDPLHRGLLFERFLSPDRQKPPDIDMDIEDTRRQELVDHLTNKYGCSQIGTFASLGAREEDDKGSVLVTYNSYLRRKIGIPAFNSRFTYKGIERIEDVQGVNKKEYVGLRRLAKHNPSKSYGVHAAGLLLHGDGQRIEDFVPSMLVPSSKTMVTQFTGDDLENMGYLKMDILGQRTLAAMRECQMYIIEGIKEGAYRQSEVGIGRDPSDFTWIPDDDRQTCTALRQGRPDTGVFQFDGWSMAKGGQKLGIKSTNDCIIAGALFRPACMESGMTDLYLRRRKYPEERVDIDYPHPVFEAALKSTYGVVLFQEQVLEIMRGLGLDYAGINVFFKIVKDSGKGATGRNLGRAAEVKKQWDGICQRNGIADPEQAWHYIEGYTQYGFNKAHSTGYGLRSYRAQYLKTHFPLEYMAAVLRSVAGKPKEKVYLSEARYMGIRLLPPDVNVSSELWTIDRKKNGIRRGLLSVNKVGKGTAEEIVVNAPYTSLDDMAERVSARALRGGRDWKARQEFAGVILELRNAGALTSLGYGRMSDD